MTSEDFHQGTREAVLLRHAADVVVELGGDGRILFVSPAAESILSRSPASFRGRSFLEIVLPEDRAETLAHFQKVMTTGSDRLVRFRVPRLDGLRIEFEATVRAFEGEDGDRRIVCVARDITQQSAEDAVSRQRDDHYRAIVESGDRPAAIATPNGEIIFSNQRFKRLFGSNTTLTSLFLRSSATARQAIESAWFTSNRPDQPGSGAGDFDHPNEDGTTSWYAATWQGFQTREDQRQVSVLFEEISQRKAVEHALLSVAQGFARGGAESTRRNMEMIAEALQFDRFMLGGLVRDDPGVLHVVDVWQDGAFLDVDRVELAELPDATVAEGDPCIHPAGLCQLIPSVATRIGPDMECYAGVPLRRSDGTTLGLISGYGRNPITDPALTRSLLAAFAPQASAAIEQHVGKMEAFDPSSRLPIASSIDDLPVIDEDQENLLHDQAQKMEAVGRLAGGIAHDFNNLLTAIIGYADLVLDELREDHVAQQDVGEILRAAERAGGLTRQLLAFSRRQVLQPTPVDLNAIVADIDRMMRRLIGENIDLVTYQDGGLRQIIADPGQIEQVIVNLVVNARDAMPQGGRLEIETANEVLNKGLRTHSGPLPPGEYVRLSVTDTGTGMDEETRAQIFAPFFTTKETHHGTGLGLASVHEIVLQSGGQIDVETSSDAGSCFTAYFPVAQQTSEKALPKAQHLSSRGRETILLVEDSAPVRRLVQRTLEKSGYTVLVAGSATAALRHCGRHQGSIELLLTDVVLPRTDGPEIARRALEQRPEIRVLYMSGSTDEVLAQHGLEGHEVELLEKPFTRATVLSRVRTLLDQPAKIDGRDRSPWNKFR